LLTQLREPTDVFSGFEHLKTARRWRSKLAPLVKAKDVLHRRKATGFLVKPLSAVLQGFRAHPFLASRVVMVKHV
jgi:hypothetical protein